VQGTGWKKEHCSGFQLFPEPGMGGMMGRWNMWYPMNERRTMEQAMDRLLDETWGRQSAGWRRGERVALLPVDVYSTANELIIQASVAGLDPEDIEISIEGETLTIKGERKAPLDNVDYYIQERRFGPFGRTLTLNVPIQADQAEAVFDKGVLTLTIPKAEEIRPKTIKVQTA
jgi:HSP20 family protein